MLRYLFFFSLVFVIFLVAVVFAASNPGVIDVDLIVTRIELQKSLAFILFLAIGWFAGAISAGFLLLGLLADRRKLRRSMRLAETEIASLRSMPVNDAD